MSKTKVISEHPLLIEVTITFPLQRIQNVYIKNPTDSYRDDINITREQAKYLYESLGILLGEKEPEQLGEGMKDGGI